MKKNKSKIDYTQQDENGLYKPIVKIKDKNVRAQYYYDGSGYLEVLHKKDQLFVVECGKASDQLEDLQHQIDRRKKEILTLEYAKDVLEEKLNGVKFTKEK
jgi:hypothetical protein